MSPLQVHYLQCSFLHEKAPKNQGSDAGRLWISSSKKGIVIFALPGKPGLAELAGDFRIYFHDRHGDFYCWLNTAVIENRMVLSSDDDLDGFDRRKLPSPRFQLEIVMADYDASIYGRPRNDRSSEKSDGGANPNATGGNSANGIATFKPGQNSPASDHTTNHHTADMTH